MSREEYNKTQKLDADRLTQDFSSRATIEKYDYKVEDSEFANISVSKQKISPDFIKSQVTQLCLNKLDKTGGFEISTVELRNCQKKALINYSLYY
jgi:hypothetical protein